MNIRSIKTERRVYELSGNRNESEKWKKDLNGILAVQYQAGSEGVDLTYSNYLVYYSLTHSLMQYDQSMARVHRPNQKKVVTVIHLIIENSIDEEMLLSLRNKRNIIQDVMENGRI
jgi:SNF2 family DNA or RNA helicase